MTLDRLTYCLLPGHNAIYFHEALKSGYQAFYDSLFSTWKADWQLTFKELRSEASVEINDFLRQNVYSGIFLDDQVKALLLFSFFNLRFSGHLQHRYLRLFPQDFLHQLQTRGIHLIMTMEYLAIHPHYRKRNLGLSIKDIICCLALKYFIHSEAQSAIAVTRVDRSINEIFYRRGASAILTGGTMHNVPIDLIHLEKMKELPRVNSPEDLYIDFFWKHRMDLTGRTQPFLFSEFKNQLVHQEGVKNDRTEFNQVPFERITSSNT